MAMRILLTNDDGIEAPGLIPFARALQTVGDVVVVVPDRERSWVAKAITRFDPVGVERRTVGGVEVHACSGYPADCVQLGIHVLFPSKPDIVVSGVNIGYNHGTAYLQSSGTAGAALEAGIAGVPAIAFSTGSEVMGWKEWKAWALSPEATEMWGRVGQVAARVVADAYPLLFPGDVLNVGIPDAAEVDTPRRITRVGRVGYDRLFAEQSPGVYVHSYGGLVHAEDGGDGTTDVGAAEERVIAITPISGAGDAVRKVDLDGLV
jgi:5'-nucleotidase